MQDGDALVESWFVQTEPVELVELGCPSLRPSLAPALLFVAVIVLAPLIYAGIAMM
jgi:hypothetical protein